MFLENNIDINITQTYYKIRYIAFITDLLPGARHNILPYNQFRY